MWILSLLVCLPLPCSAGKTGCIFRFPSADGMSFTFAFVALKDTVRCLELRGEAAPPLSSETLGFWFIYYRSSTFCPRLSLVAMFVYLLWE